MSVASVAPVVQVRVAVEVAETEIRLVLFSSEGGEPESRVSIPIVADDARGLADALFFAAKKTDPVGHQVMLERIGKAMEHELIQASKPIGGVH